MEKLCPSCYNEGAKDLTPTEAQEKYHGACGTSSTGAADANIEDIVAEVTKRVLEKYNK